MIRIPYEQHSNDPNIQRVFYRVDVCLQYLTSRISSLPPLDPDGHSECPFAHELYQTASEWREEMENQLSQLEQHEAARQGSIAAYDAQIREVEWDMDGDYDPEVFKERTSRVRHERGCDQRWLDGIQERIKKCREILKLSATKLARRPR